MNKVLYPPEICKGCSHKSENCPFIEVIINSDGKYCTMYDCSDKKKY